ncbi:MAG TPA: glycosyltransferase family 1 protein, partial [Puia sp.]|nr:glycosyltransferase family 1 protein [Puia sp.]
QYVVLCTSSTKKALRKIPTPENVKIVIIPKKTRFSSALVTLKHIVPLRFLLFHQLNAMEKISRKHNIDLIWFVDGWTHDACDTPYVATVWDLQHRTHPWFPEVSSQGTWEYREMTHSRFLKRASHIITGTQVGKQQLGWFYQIPDDQISIIPHPLPLMNYKVQQEIITNSVFENAEFLKKPFFFYPAQFWAHKNHVNLLHALKVLMDNYSHDVNLVFTGSDKGNLPHIISVANKLGIQKNVFALGFVSTEQLVFLYRHAIALTYVSFSGPENLPPLEAFSLNCPVINADFPGAKEQLGEAALYVNPYSPENIADQMHQVIRDKKMRMELIEKGKDQLKEKGADKFIKKVFAIFDNFEPIRRTWG